MKQFIILSAALILFLNACKKDSLPLPDYWKGPQTYGSAKCMRNSTMWEGSALCAYNNFEDSTHFALLAGTADADTVTLESLGMVRIPLKLGTYKFFRNNVNANSDNPGPGCRFWIGYYDEYDASWDVAINKESSITVESYDTVSKIIKGRFDVYLVKDQGVINYTDNLSFEGGTFEAKLAL